MPQQNLTQDQYAIPHAPRDWIDELNEWDHEAENQVDVGGRPSGFTWEEIVENSEAE